MTLETCLGVLRDCQHQAEEFRFGEFLAGMLLGMGLLAVIAWMGWGQRG